MSNTITEVKLKMTLPQRMGVINYYLGRETKYAREQKISYDVLLRIGVSEKDQAEWLDEIQVSPGVFRYRFTEKGKAVPPVEYTFTRAEASDILGMLNSVKMAVMDMAWAGPLLDDLGSQLGTGASA